MYTSGMSDGTTPFEGYYTPLACLSTNEFASVVLEFGDGTEAFYSSEYTGE